MNTYKKFFSLLKDKKKQIVFLYSISITASIIEIFGIGLIGGYIGLVSDANFFDNFKFINLLPFEFKSLNYISKINYVGVLVLLVLIFRSLMLTFLNYIITKITYNSERDLRINLAKTFLQMSYLEVIKKDQSEFYNSLTVHCQQYAGAIQNTLKLFSDVIFLLGIIFLLLAVNFSLFLIMFFLIFILFVANHFLISRRVKLFGKKITLDMEKVFKNIKEGFQGYKELKILNKTNHFMDAIKVSSKNIAKNNIYFVTFNFILRYIIEFIIGFMIVVMIIIMVNFYNTPELITTIVIFSISAVRALPLISSCVNANNHMAYTSYAINKIYEYIKFSENSEQIYLEQKPIKKFNCLKLVNINFYYRKENKILKNINLEIKKGEIIGIVGPSGSGKTTLVDIITGLIEPISGKIIYNGKILTSPEIRTIRSKIAYLPQQSFIFNDTIANNISFNLSNENINKNKIYSVLKDAEILELVKKLPNEVDYILGDQGAKLSGGEQQRISLARALYFGRELLILDEFTSALDESVEKKIMDMIVKQKNEKGIIIVTHKKSALSYCDKIYNINSSEINEVKK